MFNVELIKVDNPSSFSEAYDNEEVNYYSSSYVHVYPIIRGVGFCQCNHAHY